MAQGKSTDRTKKQLLNELMALRQQMDELEATEAEFSRLREVLNVVYDAIDSTVSGVIITDLEGIISYANSSFLRMFEYGEGAQVLGENVADLFLSQQNKKLTDADATINKMHGETEEFIARRADGTIFPVEVALSNVTDSTGEVVGRMASFVDISECKEAEHKLEKRNTEIRNFVDLVTHDLKVPIVSIHGLCSRLLKNYGEKLEGKGCEYVELIQGIARRMELLVIDLLTLSRIEQFVPTFSSASSLEIVKETTSRLEDRLREGRIELVVPDTLPTILCDREMMSQLFENLLVNAIKFMGGAEQPRIEIGYEDKGEIHQFCVRDNGIGIDRKYHGRIFEMFSRLRDIEDEEGTGLGLPIVDNIVSRHGGRVWVESEKGKGTSFCFTLPKRGAGTIKTDDGYEKRSL